MEASDRCEDLEGICELDGVPNRALVHPIDADIGLVFISFGGDSKAVMATSSALYSIFVVCFIVFYFSVRLHCLLAKEFSLQRNDARASKLYRLLSRGFLSLSVLLVCVRLYD